MCKKQSTDDNMENDAVRKRDDTTFREKSKTDKETFKYVTYAKISRFYHVFFTL